MRITDGKLSLIWVTPWNKMPGWFLALLLTLLPTVALAETDGEAQVISSVSATAYFACATCHGYRGEGMPSRGAPAISGMDEAYLIRQFKNYQNGSRGAHSDDFYGQQMALIAAACDADFIAQLAKIISQMPVQRAVAASSVRGDSDRGAQLYRSCSTCHGEHAEGILSMRTPAMGHFTDVYLQRQLMAYRDGWRGGKEANADTQAMSKLVKQVLPKDQDIADIISYIRSRSSQ